MTFPTCYTPCSVKFSQTDKSADDRSFSKNTFLISCQRDIYDATFTGAHKKLYIVSHAFTCDCLPSLLYNYHLSHPMQTSHFVYESLHNDDSDYRKKNFMLLNFVNFKYHKTLVQEVELPVGVQQIIALSPPR